MKKLLFFLLLLIPFTLKAQIIPPVNDSTAIGTPGAAYTPSFRVITYGGKTLFQSRVGTSTKWLTMSTTQYNRNYVTGVGSFATKIDSLKSAINHWVDFNYYSKGINIDGNGDDGSQSIRYKYATNLYDVLYYNPTYRSLTWSRPFNFAGGIQTTHTPVANEDIPNRGYNDSIYSKKVNFINALDYGIVNDGATDNTAAINTVLSIYKAVYFPAGTYLLSGSIQMAKSQTIRGEGTSTVFKISADTAAIHITSSNALVKDIKVLGSGRGTGAKYTTTKTHQNGIKITGVVLNTQIINVNTDSMANAGIRVGPYGTGNNYPGEGATISGGHHMHALYGVLFDNRAEYNTMTGVKATKNQYGVYNWGGNNSIIGGAIDSNRTGLKIDSGLNDSHSSVTGTTINHNLEYGVDITHIKGGIIFSTCPLYFNPIRLTGSELVTFDNCLFKSDSLIFNNTVMAVVQNSRFVNVIIPVLSGTYRFNNNTYAGGTPSQQPESTGGNFAVSGALTVNGNSTINGNNTIVGSETVSGNTTGTLSYVRILANAANRFAIGSDAGITAGSIGDINAYVYGANNFFISTNNVKRLTVAGNGLINIPILTASLPVKTDASKNLISGAINLSGAEVTGVLPDANVATTIARLASPTFTGIPTAPTATAGTNNTQIATTAFVQAATSALIDNILSKTANYTIVAGDFAAGKKTTLDLYVDATSGNVTITMPSATIFAGYTIFVTKTDASANTITINTVSGLNTLVSQYQVRQFNTAPTIGWVNH